LGCKLAANIIFVSNASYNQKILIYFKTRLPKYSHIRIMGMLLLLLYTVSCKQKYDTRDGNTEEFKLIEKRVDSLLGTDKSAEAIRYLDSAFRHVTNPTISDRYKVYGFHYFYTQKHLGDSKAALLYADTMLTLAKESIHTHEYAALYADANFAMGDASFSLQRYDEAYQHLFQSYLIGRNTVKDKMVLSDYTYRLGMITYKMGNYKLAKNYFKKSYDYYNILTDLFVSFYHAQELLDNIALSYKHENQPDSAIIYFDKSLAFINKYGPQFKDRVQNVEAARGVVYGNKADIYMIQGDYAKAIDLLKKSISINLQKDYDNNDAVLSEIKLARIYNSQRRDRELYDLLSNIAAHQKAVKNPDAEADWNYLMSKFYERKGDLKKSLDHLNTYLVQKDSITLKLTLLKESDISKQLENYEKQQQIDKLSNNNKTQSTLLYVSIVIVIMALVILFLIFRNWRRSRRDIETVYQLNQQIKAQNADLEKALDELKVSSQEKDRILRTVAHDLRNPIGGIASLTSIMANEEYTEEQMELINLVKETSYNSLELINEILEATNISSIELNPELVEINSLVNNSVELLRFKASEKGQQIFFEPLNHPLELLISREKIWRVISNLISNAIKFSPTGAPIFVKVVKENEQAVISVMDNGIGIPDKLKDQVFNMFTTAQRPGTAGEKSFGLGLSICKQIIEKSHGKIWFDSSKHGTIFFISLPLPGKERKPDELPKQVGIPQS
jgi:two-component system sensor histidine kinase VicK